MSSYSALFLSLAMASASPVLAFSAVCSGVSCFGAGATLTGGLAAGFGGSLTVRSTLRASSSVLASALSCSYALWSPLSMAIVSLMMRRDAAM